MHCGVNPFQTVASGGPRKTLGRLRAGVRDALASQFQMVAGACNQRRLLITYGFAERLTE